MTKASRIVGEPQAFSKLARKISRMIDNREMASALDSAGRLIHMSPTETHRRIACDLQVALAGNDDSRARRIASNAGRQPGLRAEKIISREYKYLWMCIPKVASRSIKYTLLDMDPTAELIEQKTIAEVYALYPASRSYYSFAFVRHPFHRTLSFYREVFFSPQVYAETYHSYQGRGDRYFFHPVTGRPVPLPAPLCEVTSPLHKAQKRRQLSDLFHGLEEASSFDDVCRWLNTPYGSDAFADRHFLSQHVQMRLAGGRLPDFIGRLENIDTDLNRVASDLGMPAPRLPLLNTMAGWQSSPGALKVAREAAEVDLNDRSKALLRTRYAGDFELFGYSPD